MLFMGPLCSHITENRGFKKKKEERKGKDSMEGALLYFLNILIQ